MRPTSWQEAPSRAEPAPTRLQAPPILSSVSLLQVFPGPSQRSHAHTIQQLQGIESLATVRGLPVRFECAVRYFYFVKCIVVQELGQKGPGGGGVRREGRESLYACMGWRKPVTPTRG
jgi:hypothetical protein